MTKVLIGLGLLSSLGLVIACGGDSEAGPLADPDAGADASAGQGGTGTAGDGGSGGSPAGTGGLAGTGAIGGGGGAAPDAAIPCDPPTDPTKAALCLELAPESVTFESDPRLDGMGVFFVEVFDTPDPEPATGPNVMPITSFVHPAQTSDAGFVEASITSAPVIRFDDLPDAVYVRAIFVDNSDTLTSEELTWGAFLGGVDLAGGFDDATVISTVSLTIGQGRALTMPMTALRRLTVSMTASATPLDDGEGPAQWVAFDTQAPGMGSNVFGLGEIGCGSVVQGPLEVEGWVTGTGERWVFARLDDFAVGGDDPPGSLASVEAADSGPQLPLANRVNIGQQQYSLSLAVDLNYGAPLLADAAVPPGFACMTAADAGAD